MIEGIRKDHVIEHNAHYQTGLPYWSRPTRRAVGWSPAASYPPKGAIATLSGNGVFWWVTYGLLLRRQALDNKDPILGALQAVGKRLLIKRALIPGPRVRDRGELQHDRPVYGRAF
jgi:hypothetical protein